MQPLDDLNDTKGYWKLKEKAPNRTLWGTRFKRGYGPGIRQNERTTSITITNSPKMKAKIKSTV
jgi:hypothetical protein